MDWLPFPAYKYAPLDIYFKNSGIIMSEESLKSKKRLDACMSLSCPFLCRFCWFRKFYYSIKLSIKKIKQLQPHAKIIAGGGFYSAIPYDMVFVTAEIGVNWDGNFELVEKMIKKSRDVGCQAVKFQAFNEETVKNHPEKKRLLKNSITEENIEKINEISKNVGIEWFCTPMYTGAVDMLEPFVKKFKIREYDSRDILKGEKNKVFDTYLLSFIEQLPLAHMMAK